MFTKSEVANFRSDFQAAMAALESKYGCKVSLGTITYTASDFHGKITVEKNEVAGQQFAEYEFNKYRQQFGIVPTFGAVFVANGKHWMVCGLNPKAPKFPVQIKDSTGKIFRATVKWVNAYFQPATAKK